MALSDEDKAEIASMIAESSSRTPPAPTGRRPPVRSGQADPGAGMVASQSDWDRMSERDRQTWIRQEVEDHLASLDAEAERLDLRRENDELRKQVAEWEKGGRKGAKPKAGDPDAKRGEEAPTILSTAYKYLFGSGGQSKAQQGSS